MTLARHQSVDVDAPTARTADEQDGAVGAFDLFHDSGPVQSDSLRGHGMIAVYPAGAAHTSAYEICADYTGTDPSYNSRVPATGFTLGTTICFTTSENHIAWATVQAVSPDSRTVTLEVRVWNEQPT